LSKSSPLAPLIAILIINTFLLKQIHKQFRWQFPVLF
jgi:hypothetical protein